ncbi:MAG: sulfatase-like hydrolase/transferase [Lachnospiraceae bacterium]|nr:sulfatase-like hydrolase/transferase [Lachnospiraceae bacterium]
MNKKDILKKIESNEYLFIMILSLLTFFEVEALNGDGKFFIVGNAFFFLVNLILYFILYFLPGLFVKNLKISSIVVMVFINLIAWINNIVIQFRGIAFKINDILAAKTAANVVDMYTIKFGIFHLVWLGLFVLSLVMIFLWANKTERKIIDMKGINKIVISAILIIGLVVVPWKIAEVGLNSFDGWYVGGYNLFFISSFSSYKIPKPSGYDASKYSDITKVDNNSGKRPNIIVIMNESFCDYNRITNIESSEDVLPFFRKFIKEDNIIEGDAYVSIFGGMTPNSEMEFLTGSTLGFWGYQNVCYSMGYRKKLDILPEWLKQIGYDTYAMHPASGDNYGRKIVYRYMDFNNIWFYDEFINAGAKTVHFDDSAYFLHEIVPDSENYRIINEEIEKNDKPVFIFNTTIQNHGGYDWRGYDDVKLLTKVNSKKLETEMNEYLTLISDSDKALEEFIGELRESKEDTIVLFFGDHQPILTKEMVDDGSAKIDLVDYYRVPYFIWANFEIEEKHDVNTSLNYLQNTVLKQAQIGLLNEFQKHLDAVEEKYPIFCVAHTEDSNGNVCNFNDLMKNDDMIKEYYRQAYHIIYDAE